MTKDSCQNGDCGKQTSLRKKLRIAIAAKDAHGRGLQHQPVEGSASYEGSEDPSFLSDHDQEAPKMLVLPYFDHD